MTETPIYIQSFPDAVNKLSFGSLLSLYAKLVERHAILLYRAEYALVPDLLLVHGRLLRRGEGQ